MRKSNIFSSDDVRRRIYRKVRATRCVSVVNIIGTARREINTIDRSREESISVSVR